MGRTTLRLPVGVGLFCQQLLNWYQRRKRDLPWRGSRDPYQVWLSEVMLQQTRVNTVIPYFERFLRAYPSLTDLANAEEDQVLDSWSGLGYYGRARNLHKAARIIRDQFDGIFPSTYEEAIRLPGIGPYSAAAILSIAFGKQYAVLDGNVRRFLTRYLALQEDVKGPGLKRVEALLAEIASSDHVAHCIADFNQALMELGALVCTPRDPSCAECPLRKSCRAFAAGLQNALPRAGKKSVPQEVIFTSVVIERESRYLMCRNTDEDYLKNFWEFPKIIGSPVRKKIAVLFRQFHGLDLSPEELFEPVVHRITFRRIRFYPVTATLLSDTCDGPFHWVKFGEKPYPTSSYIQKILKRVTSRRP